MKKLKVINIMKKNKLEEQIIRKFMQMLNCEIGYPSIASSHPVPVVGLGHPETAQVPDSFKGKIDLHDAVDTLFYQFSISQILDAIVSHLMTQVQGAGDNEFDMGLSLKRDPQEVQHTLDSISDLKNISDKLR